MPLVQGLSHQIHLFLVEYNRCNHLPSNLPGYKPRNCNNNDSLKTGIQVPEEILHQQRLLLQSCDRLKLSVSRHQVTYTSVTNIKDKSHMEFGEGPSRTKIPSTNYIEHPFNME